MANPMLSIGDLARRTGLTVSAIRFYEARRLIQPERTSGNQRRFRRCQRRLKTDPLERLAPVEN